MAREPAPARAAGRAARKGAHVRTAAPAASSRRTFLLGVSWPELLPLVIGDPFRCSRPGAVIRLVIDPWRRVSGQYWHKRCGDLTHLTALPRRGPFEGPKAGNNPKRQGKTPSGHPKGRHLGLVARFSGRTAHVRPRFCYPPALDRGGHLPRRLAGGLRPWAGRERWEPPLLQMVSHARPHRDGSVSR